MIPRLISRPADPLPPVCALGTRGKSAHPDGRRSGRSVVGSHADSCAYHIIFKYFGQKLLSFGSTNESCKELRPAGIECGTSGRQLASKSVARPDTKNTPQV